MFNSQGKKKNIHVSIITNYWHIIEKIFQIKLGVNWTK